MKKNPVSASAARTARRRVQGAKIHCTKTGEMIGNLVVVKIVKNCIEVVQLFVRCLNLCSRPSSEKHQM